VSLTGYVVILETGRNRGRTVAISPQAVREQGDKLKPCKG